MKTFYFLLTLSIAIIRISAQPPEDSLLLKTIYGNYDTGGHGYTRWLESMENIAASSDSITYKILHKQFISIHKKDRLLVIVAAPLSEKKGKVLAYWENYIFMKSKNFWTLDSTWKCNKGTQRSFGADSLSYNLVKLGKNQNVLLEKSSFHNNGYQYEQAEIIEIKNSELRPIGHVTLAFTNKDFELAQEDGTCLAESMESKIEWMNAGKTYKDFKITKNYYYYGPECIEKQFQKAEIELWKWKNTGYVLDSTTPLQNSKSTINK